MTQPELPDPGSADLDLLFLHMQNMDMIRRVADERAVVDYGREPDLARHTRTEAESLAQATCESYGVDSARNPSGATLTSAFHKLLFGFADRSGYHDSLTDRALLTEMGRLLEEVAAATGTTPGVRELATYLDMFAAHMYLIRKAMGDEVLAGLSPDEQLVFVRSRLEQIIQSAGNAE